jgi:hypothetical protein
VRWEAAAAAAAGGETLAACLEREQRQRRDLGSVGLYWVPVRWAVGGRLE